VSAPQGGPGTPHRVVVVGGGFGGLQAVRKLDRPDVAVTLVDRRSFHLFQPLLYQVATGVLGAGEIAAPLRAVFRRRRNVHVVLGDVTGFDLAGRNVLVDRLPTDEAPAVLPYDTLVVAAGSNYSYFGHDEWRPLAPDVKTLESARTVRSRLYSAFEAAELETDEARRQAWMTFVIVGGGPTGVELAGQMAELAHGPLREEFRTTDTADSRILIVEMADRILPAFPPSLSAKAARALVDLGATPRVRTRVTGIESDAVTLAPAGGGPEEHVPARTTVWAAGIVASGLAAALAAESGANVDRGGRVEVGPQLTLPGHPEVIALGDMAHVHDATGAPVDLPGLAPVAMQQGRYAARLIAARLERRSLGPFRYRDKGALATIGRARAVADIKPVRLSGLPAWLAWLGVHIVYLIGMQNRLLVLTRWAFSYLTRTGGARLIARPDASAGGEPVPARASPPTESVR
jgi:NADH dehydrogenase